MKQYINMLKEVLREGINHDDRTGTGRRSLNTLTCRYDLRDGFPLVTTRYINPEIPIKDLCWTIEGSDNINKLDSKIWDKWAVKPQDVKNFISKYFPNISQEDSDQLEEYLIQKYEGSVGKIYGSAWRFAPCGEIPVTNILNRSLDDLAPDQYYMAELYLQNAAGFGENYSNEKMNKALIQVLYGNIDQLHLLINNINNNPGSARHIISHYIPEFLPIESLPPQENVLLGKGALAPCPAFQQYFPVHTNGKKYLDLTLYQRSGDLCIGVPTNIAVYSAMLSLVARFTDHEPRYFNHICGDAHIYLNHLELAQEQAERIPLELSTLEIDERLPNIFAVQHPHMKIKDYKHHPAINYIVS